MRGGSWRRRRRSWGRSVLLVWFYVFFFLSTLLMVDAGYPFLQEAKVTAISDELFKYMLSDAGQVLPVPHSPYEADAWRKKAERMENNYSKRMGILIGPVEVVIHTAILKGLKRTDEGAMIKEYAVIAGVETDYAAQTVVDDVISEDQRFLEKPAVPIGEEFPDGTRAFFLGEFNYGRPLEVIRHEGNKVDVWIYTMVRYDISRCSGGANKRVEGERAGLWSADCAAGGMGDPIYPLIYCCSPARPQPACSQQDYVLVHCSG